MSETNLQPTQMSGAKTEERKPVMCPWCGEKMQAVETQDIFHGIHNFYECTSCEARTPIGYSIEAAYLSATRTTLNLPLTREQVEALDDLDAVWVDEMGCKTFLRSGEWAKEFLKKRNLQGYCMFKYFAHKPTPADIEAARKEHNA